MFVLTSQQPEYVLKIFTGLGDKLVAESVLVTFSSSTVSTIARFGTPAENKDDENLL